MDYLRGHTRPFLGLAFGPSTCGRRWPFASCCEFKENIILSRLIPAGTGMTCYRSLEVEEGGYPDPSLHKFTGGDDFLGSTQRLGSCEVGETSSI